MRNFYQKTGRLALVLLFITQIAGAQVLNEGFISPIVLRQGETKIIRQAGAGKLYVFGDFKFHGDRTIKRLIRLNADGLLDASFNAERPLGESYNIEDFEVLSNGNVAIASTDGVTGRKNVEVLEPDGKFLGALTRDYPIYPLDLEPDTNGGFFLAPLYTGGVDADVIQISSNLADEEHIASVNGQIKEIKLHGSHLTVVGQFSMAYDKADGAWYSRNLMARFDLSGGLDFSFDAGSALEGFESVEGVLVQPDGKVIPLDKHTPFSGKARPIRLNANGSLDTGFAYPFPSNLAIEYAFYVNGKITIVTNTKIARLNSDGTLDSSFSIINFDPANVIATVLPDLSVVAGNYAPATYGFAKFTSSGIRVNEYYARLTRYGYIYSMDRTSTSIFIGGDFVRVGNHFTRGVARLNLNGTILTKFKASFTTPVLTVEALPNAKVLVNTSTRIYRLDREGTADRGFSYAPIAELPFIDKFIRQPDGKILIGGGFRVFRLRANGSRDLSFDADAGRDIVQGGNMNFELDRQSGKIYYSNWHYSEDVPLAPELLRLNPNGSRDQSFSLTTFPPQSFFTYKKVLVLDNNEVLLVKPAFLFEDHSYDVVKLNGDGSLNEEFMNNLEGEDYTWSQTASRFGDRIILLRQFLDDPYEHKAIFLDGVRDTEFWLPDGIRESDRFYSDNDTELFLIRDYAGPSPIVKITYPSTSGSATARSAETSGFGFFPNPVKDRLTVDVKARSTVNIFDGTGLHINTAVVDEVSNTIDLDQLKPGRYVIEVITDGKIYREHLVKE